MDARRLGKDVRSLFNLSDGGCRFPHPALIHSLLRRQTSERLLSFCVSGSIDADCVPGWPAVYIQAGAPLSAARGAEKCAGRFCLSIDSVDCGAATLADSRTAEFESESCTA